MSDPLLHQRRAVIEASPDALPDGLLAKINAQARRALAERDVFARSMYLCSDRVCPSDHLRFTPRALAAIARLLPGRSVLAGHDRASLPLARFCHAALVQRPDHDGLWVRAWFYWLRDTAGARDLLLNLDGGIYREVSIAWRYRDDVCSICNAARHGCDHVPGRDYQGRLCHRVIDEVVDVLEGSLVYRGADAGACVTGLHHADGPAAGPRLLEFNAEHAAALAALLASLPRAAPGWSAPCRCVWPRPCSIWGSTCAGARRPPRWMRSPALRPSATPTAPAPTWWSSPPPPYRRPGAPGWPRRLCTARR